MRLLPFLYLRQIHTLPALRKSITRRVDERCPHGSDTAPVRFPNRAGRVEQADCLNRNRLHINYLHRTILHTLFKERIFTPDSH